MERLNMEQFENAADKAVKDKQGHGWWVYEHYEILEEDGELFVIAPLTFDSVFRADSMEERTSQDAETQGRGWRRYAGRSPQEDAMTIYAPLSTPELVLDLAELAEKEITPEAVLGWAQVYGLLGFPDDDLVKLDLGFMNFKVKGMGRRDSIQRFAEAAGEVRGCLRIYEAITSDEELDLDELSSAALYLPREAALPIGGRKQYVEQGRSYFFGMLGKMVNMRLNEFVYPLLAIHTRRGLPIGKFALSWGFKGLIGAIWLQLAWLLDAESERVRRCKLPDCLRVVHFEPGEAPIEPGLKKNARGKYKTRSDREFCKGRPCKQKYHYRKQAGWPDYS